MSDCKCCGSANTLKSDVICWKCGEPLDSFVAPTGSPAIVKIIKDYDTAFVRWNTSINLRYSVRRRKERYEAFKAARDSLWAVLGVKPENADLSEQPVKT